MSESPEVPNRSRRTSRLWIVGAGLLILGIGIGGSASLWHPLIWPAKATWPKEEITVWRTRDFHDFKDNDGIPCPSEKIWIYPGVTDSALCQELGGQSVEVRMGNYLESPLETIPCAAEPEPRYIPCKNEAGDAGQRNQIASVAGFLQ